MDLDDIRFRALLACCVLATVPALAQTGEMEAAPPSPIRLTRPPAARLSPLQSLVDAAAPGQIIRVGPGTYRGELFLDRRVHLVGEGRPLLIAATDDSVVEIRADDVVIEGFDIDGERRGDLGRDSSAIHIAAKRAIVRNCSTRNTLFGIYLREADGSTVESCTIRGVPGSDPGEKGSGIHVWNTDGYRLLGNDIAGVRDGFYIQSSPHGTILRNSARDLRYGLHYMFSDDNRFEDNTFENGAAGTALMYSRRIIFRRNRFLHNRGFASVGLLLKNCDNVIAEDNLIADNARGIFVEGSIDDVFRRNLVIDSDTAIVLYDSCQNIRFEGNAFIANLTALTLVGRRTDTKFDGNFWSENDEPDLDGDGRSDRPYRLSSVFDHFRGNVLAADLMSLGLAASALSAAEKMFPVLDPIPVEDHSPLAGLPVFPSVPRPSPASGRVHAAGLVLSLLVLGAGTSVMIGRRHASRGGR
jgi:nitrous oxidase accessory protein